MAVTAEGDEGGLDEVEIIAIPQIRLGNPLLADEPAIGQTGHVGASRSFGSRTRL